MWGRKDEPFAGGDAPAADKPETVTTPPAARTAPAKPTPLPTPPKQQGERSGRTTAQIGKSLKIKGTITGSEDLYVDGEIEGNIELEENSLTVGPNGNVNADVKARDITVLGRLTGNVRAGERIEIRRTGSLEGDLVTSRIVIEDGAVFRGSIDIVKPDQAGASSPPLKPLGKTSSAAEAAKAGGGGAGKPAQP